MMKQIHRITMDHFDKLLIRLALLSTLLLATTASLKAQSLEGYLQMGASENPGLKAQYKLYLAALEKVEQQGALPDPTVSFGYFISPIETRVGAQRLRLSLRQMFPWMGTLKVKKHWATHRAKVQYEAFIETRNQLFLAIQKQWLALYLLEKEIQIMQNDLDILRSYEPVTQTKYESNLVSLADLVRVQIKVEEATTKLDILKLKKRPLLSEFNRLLNREASIPVSLPDSIILTIAPVSLDSAMVSQPRIRAVKSQIEVANDEVALANLKSRPSLGFGLDYAMVDQREAVVLEDNGKDVLMPMVSLSLPVFGKKNRASKKEAQLKKEAFSHQLEQEQRSLRSQWDQATFEIEKARTELTLYENELDKTELLLKTLIAEYTNNNREFESLLDVQQMMLELRLQQLRAEIRLQEHLFQKEYLTGNYFAQ